MDLIKTSFLFSDEKKEQYKLNNTVQQTLRQDVEDLNMKLIEQKEQYRKLQEQLSKSDSATKDADELVARFKKLEHMNIQLQEELESQKNTTKEFSSKLVDLKRKHKTLEE